MTDGARDEVLVSEIFSAIQGEAALVGERQVFLRLTGCNIRCNYCDQPEALERRPGPVRIEQTAGRRDWEVGESPLAVADVAAAVGRLWHQVPHHSVSLTGGEPLLQSARLTALLPALAGAGMPIMVETNGTLPGGLVRVLPWVTYASVDLKLPSVDGERVDPGVQRRFLAIALDGGVTTWVKIVVSASVAVDELDAAVAMVADETARARVAPVEVYLQPVTPFAGVGVAPTPSHLLDLQARALRIHPRVRVVPQTHKAIGQL